MAPFVLAEAPICTPHLKLGTCTPHLKRGTLLNSHSNTKAHILINQFVFVFKEDDEHGDIVLEGPSIPPTRDININVNGSRYYIKKSIQQNQAGVYNLPCRLLKELATEIAPVLIFIFQSLTTGQ